MKKDGSIAGRRLSCFLCVPFDFSVSSLLVFVLSVSTVICPPPYMSSSAPFSSPKIQCNAFKHSHSAWPFCLESRLSALTIRDKVTRISTQRYNSH